MMNFVQLGDVVTVTVSAGGVTSGNLIAPGNLAGALSDRHGDEGDRHLGRDGAGAA